MLPFMPFWTLTCENVEDKMAYYFSKTLPVGFDEAVRRTTEALKQQGFGILHVDFGDDPVIRGEACECVRRRKGDELFIHLLP